MIIKSNIEEKEWVDFVKNHPNGNIFQTPEMYEVYKRTKNYEPVFLALKGNNNEILGILLAVIQKEHSGILGKFSSRSIIDGGPLIKDNDEEVLCRILYEYNKIIKNRAIYSLFRNYWNWENKISVFKECGFIYEEQLDILINLNQKFELLNNKISKNKRRNVTKSLNKGVIFNEIRDIDTYEKSLILIKNTYKKINLPFPDLSLFLNVFKILYPRSMMKTFIANNNDKIIGVRIEFIFNGLMFDWYAGSDDNENNKYPNDFLVYHIIKWGNANEIHTFDFGGAGKKGVPYGVRDHKMKFGGELFEFGRLQLIHNPILFKIAKVGLFIYKLLK